jgi:hypothetical protein
MSVVQKEYMIIFDDGKADADGKWPRQTNLPSWFVNANPMYRKIVRVLGATCNYTNEDGVLLDFPKNVRLVSNLTQDVPKYGLQMSSEMIASSIVNFNFVMMVNDFNNIKEYDVTNSNLQSLKWACLYADGSYFGATTMDIVIELEIMITN